jgi:hypothetical protein
MNVCAVVSRDVVSLQCLASSHEASHRGEDFVVQYGLPQLFSFGFREFALGVLGQVLIEEREVAVHGLFPSLSSALDIEPTGVAGEVNELAVETVH